MMSRAIVFLFAFLGLFASSLVHAAPVKELSARQIGDLQCNADRLTIVGALATMQGTLSELASSASSDPATAAGVQSVQSDVTDAQQAIGTIAKALFTGQTAPASARDQVKSALLSANSTLSGLTSTDATVSSLLQKATSELKVAGAAGEGVVANCN
ncbi:hypothetical protein BD309DRAFT_956481 [Dichomitus squalens]|nr:hypothetical protein BD309DRAFT_956481 [Dichomitus squalens]